MCCATNLSCACPTDVSIVGYDDVPEAGWGGYRLTTVRQPSRPMIDAAIAILMEQIERKTVSRGPPCSRPNWWSRGAARQALKRRFLHTYSKPVTIPRRGSEEDAAAWRPSS